MPITDAQKPKLIIAGNGMAAGRLVDELMKCAADQYDISIIGEEVEGSYNRIMLSPVLAGELAHQSIIQKNAVWYEEQGMRFIGGVRVDSIQRHDNRITLSNGKTMHYDELVIATGSTPSKIPARHQHLKNIHSFRTLHDVNTIIRASEHCQHAIVIGGGLLGLEAAYGLAQNDIKVTLIHRSAWLLNRQLDEPAASLLKELMHSMNIEFRLNDEVEQFNSLPSTTHRSETDPQLASASLKSGERITCDLAIIATGISPNSELASEAGLHVNKAIVVNDFLQTSHPNISAVGECCEHDGHTFGLVEPIWQQCSSLANRLCKQTPTPFRNKPVATKLKVSGVQLFSAGQYLTQPHHRELVMQDPANKVYRKLLLDDNRIVGVVLFGDTRDGQFYFDLMQKAVNIREYVPQLIFGQAYCPHLDTQHKPDPNKSQIQAA